VQGHAGRSTLGSFFQLNVGARFSINFLLEFADFEIVSFPGRVTARDRTPEPTIVCKLQLMSMMESEELSIFQKHEAATLLVGGACPMVC
jgi:hypothetical protein